MEFLGETNFFTLLLGIALGGALGVLALLSYKRVLVRCAEGGSAERLLNGKFYYLVEEGEFVNLSLTQLNRSGRIAERYPKDWVRLDLIVAPDGQYHAIGGDREMGTGDTPYVGLERINQRLFVTRHDVPAEDQWPYEADGCPTEKEALQAAWRELTEKLEWYEDVLMNAVACLGEVQEQCNQAQDKNTIQISITTSALIFSTLLRGNELLESVYAKIRKDEQPSRPDDSSGNADGLGKLVP
jgi:hypothetical protein